MTEEKAREAVDDFASVWCETMRWSTTLTSASKIAIRRRRKTTRSCWSSIRNARMNWCGNGTVKPSRIPRSATDSIVWPGRSHEACQAAQAPGLPWLATNGVRYDAERRKPPYDALTCLRFMRKLDDAGRLPDPSAERHLEPPREMERLFSDLPEAVASTADLDPRLGFALEDRGYEFPRYPLQPGKNATSTYARWLCQGRVSTVCYSLGITAVDPVGMDLLSERFLSEERGE